MMHMLDRIWGDEEYQRAMSPVGLYTYEWIARGLPSSIRREIEETMDCIGDGAHTWDVDRPDTFLPPQNYPCRECSRCGIVRTNPSYVRPRR